jgi:type 1 glutamine amidotransferase
MKRRQILKAASAAVVGLTTFPLDWVTAAERKKNKILYFTRSAGFVHSVVNRNGGPLSHSEKVLTEMGKRAGIEVECSQDGTVFDGDLDPYDAIAFFTSGDLCIPGGTGKPMTLRGKQKLLDAVAAGKGFVGFHACTDSFRSQGDRVDPYTAMVGAEFLTHGPQQDASLIITSQFPGLNGLCMAEGISFTEEWYAQKKFAKDLHVILVQETKYMQGACYRRPDYPCTWARMQGKGRVFYTSLGHREDIWTNPFFQAIVVGGLAWVLGNANHDVKPNIDRVAPNANQLHA